MIDFLLSLPLWALALFLNAWLIGFSLASLWMLRRWFIPRLTPDAEGNRIFGAAAMQSGMVLFGLVAALTAVSVWSRHSGVSNVVSSEAIAIAGLYRDFTGYPQPARGALQDTLRGYTVQIVETAWPAHREGRVLQGGVEWMDRLQGQLYAFEPATEGQKALHAETLSAYNRVLQARRQRIDSVGSALPAVMWWVLLPGAMGCLFMCLFVQVEDGALQKVLMVCLSGFVAMVLFVTIALDRPFQGAMAIGPESYQLVIDQLMKPAK